MTGAAGTTRFAGGIDLATRYMGLQLKNPLVASASPLNADLDNVRRLEESGAAAIVLPSIFEEQIDAEVQRYEDMASINAESFQEAQTFFPEYGLRDVGAGRYLDLVRRAVEAVDVPVIASLNGATAHGWIGQAVEQRYLDIVRAVRAAVTIPVAVKLSPYFSALGNLAMELDRAGADALVLFNRFYQPDIDLVQLRILNDLELSERNEIRLPLLWVAVLSGHVSASLAASTGVQTSAEVLKYLLAGADVVMTTSALLRHGVRYVESLLAGVTSWLAARDFESLDHVRGMLSHRRIGATDVFERANYMEILRGYRAGRR